MNIKNIKIIMTEVLTYFFKFWHEITAPLNISIGFNPGPKNPYKYLLMAFKFPILNE